MTSAPPSLSHAREEFLALVGDIRPELHRYCARLTGSVIDGEDIVQETLAKGFYALAMSADVPPLRPWLFRIAHNTAIDFLKAHGKRLTDPHADMSDVAGAAVAEIDPYATRLALSRFLALPVIQRSAVILKDVLGHSLEETAETMETTVMAVKAALVRGRAKLREAHAIEIVDEVAQRAQLERYASMFNAKDWDGLRALIGEDCRLDLVSKSQRKGKDVGVYYTNYAKQDVTVRLVRLEGHLALAAHVGGAATPSYFMLLDFAGDELRLIRDFRYVPYIASDAELSEP
jgi:RNA polymerase sigma-70 factor (ECF subfamily)